MNWFEALLLGMIQGITEFLPISSSAHLVVAEKLLGIKLNEDSLSFEVFLHLASLLAVLYFFRRDIGEIIKDFFAYLLAKKEESYTNFRFGWFIIVATFITMIGGMGLESFLGDQLTNSATIGASLIVTGIFLIFIEHGITHGTRTAENMTMKDAILVGLGQTLAVIPGISRAGSTLITALWCGLSKQTAVRYSFLLSLPIILGISIIKIPEIMEIARQGENFSLLIAFLASFIFALISIKWLIEMLNRAQLSYFAIYCILLGFVTWFFL